MYHAFKKAKRKQIMGIGRLLGSIAKGTTSAIRAARAAKGKKILGMGKNLGEQILDKGIGTGIGMGMNKLGNREQLKQQEKLQDLQIKGAKELSDYQQAQSIKTWNETNYEAQIAHMKKAGLNPGLLYGMGGTGGATTATGEGGIPIGGLAAKGTETIGMGMQLELLKSQKANIDADTANKLANAKKTEGVDTDVARETIDNLASLTKNNDLKNELMKIDADIATLNEDILRKTKDGIINKTNWDSEKAKIEKEILALEKYVYDESKESIIQTAYAKLLNIEADTVLAEEQAKTEGSKRDLNKTTMYSMMKEIEQEWSKQGIDIMRIETDQAIREKANELQQYKLFIDAFGQSAEVMMRYFIKAGGSKGNIPGTKMPLPKNVMPGTIGKKP